MHLHGSLELRLYPFIVAAVVLEVVVYLAFQRRAYPWKEMVSSVVIHVARLPLRLIAPLTIAPIALFLWSHRVFTIPLDSAWGLALLFLGTEFAYYWQHRLGHEVRWMWATHVVHHTPEHIHLASAFRIGVTEFLSGNWLFRLPLYLLGLNPVAVAGMMTINLFYQFWLHTDLIGRLGPVEWVFNTPSHHRVHHASNPEYLDRNYGGILIVWDRLFGTFATEGRDSRLVYGLVHPIGSLNPARLLFAEWIAMGHDVASARNWRERWSQLFCRPANSLAARAQPVGYSALTAGAE